jgi:hypothetical protein
MGSAKGKKMKQVKNQPIGQLENDIIHRLADQIDNKSWNELWDQLCGRLSDELHYRIHYEITNELGEKYEEL